MEGPVKERLTGALILVAALAIIVPEILSGPDRQPGTAVPQTESADAGPPLLTYSMELDDSGEPAAAQATLAPQPATADPVAPAPVAVTAADAEPAPDVPAEVVPRPDVPAAEVVAVHAVSEPVPVPAKPKPVAKQIPAAGKWWSQLGSFSSRDNAEKLLRKLQADGFAMDMSKVSAAGKELYRVRAGPVQSRSEAQALQARLAASGHKSTIVAP